MSEGQDSALEKEGRVNSHQTQAPLLLPKHVQNFGRKGEINPRNDDQMAQSLKQN